jgi:hypothetical protein
MSVAKRKRENSDDERPSKKRYRSLNERLEEYCAFFTKEQRNPSEYCKNQDEKSISIWRRCLKQSTRSSNLSKENLERLLTVDPEFFKRHDDRRNDRLEAYCNFIIDERRQPKYDSHSPDEKSLANWRNDMKKTKKGASDRVSLSPEQIEKVLSIDPDFFNDVNTLRDRKIEAYCNFIIDERRQPKSGRTPEKQVLYTWRKAVKNANKTGKSNLSEEQLRQLLSVDPYFFIDRCKIKQNNVDKYCDFIKTEHIQPRKDRNNSQYEIFLYNWRLRMKQVSKGLRDQSPLTDQQIKQILSVDPAFFNIRNLTLEIQH